MYLSFKPKAENSSLRVYVAKTGFADFSFFKVQEIECIFLNGVTNEFKISEVLKNREFEKLG